MQKLIAYTVFIAIIPIAASAATCDAGDYLKDGECTTCESGYYCPGDDARVQCPRDTNDWYAIFSSEGYEVLNIGTTFYWSWGVDGGPISAITNCHIGFHVLVSTGTFYMEPEFTDTIYDPNRSKLWHSAKPGYYLSQYSGLNNHDWYRGVKPCTNAPENAHYTGPGTPDEPKYGGATDYNDCPWACDDGYGRHNDACVPLCTAGIQHIKTGSGVTINLYPIAYSAPALHVNYNGQTCFGTLASGSANGAINIKHNNQVFHTVD